MGKGPRVAALLLLAGVGGLLPHRSAGAQIDYSGRPCRDPSLRPGEYIDEHLIYFDHGSPELPKREWVDVVLRSAICWASRGATSVELIAHADRSGESVSNLDLAQRRGLQVAKELVRRGLDPSLISVIARGETSPPVPTPDGTREPLNRLVVITWRGGS